MSDEYILGNNEGWLIAAFFMRPIVGASDTLLFWPCFLDAGSLRVAKVVVASGSYERALFSTSHEYKTKAI